jgi:O-acetyl-ADP-ribose deacetylase (regulator of RNase III)
MKVVTFVKGDIFKSPAQVLTNTVNCVGVMGRGIALEFKRRFPRMFGDYRIKCEHGEVKPGQPYLWEDDATQILNFPTKRHWRDNSLLQDIEDGLKYLAATYEQMGIQSIAMPPLGCGNGGLNWTVVQPLIVKHLGPPPDLDVYVYEPQYSAAFGASTENRTAGNKSEKDTIAVRQPEA